MPEDKDRGEVTLKPADLKDDGLRSREELVAEIESRLAEIKGEDEKMRKGEDEIGVKEEDTDSVIAEHDIDDILLLDDDIDKEFESSRETEVPDT